MRRGATLSAAMAALALSACVSGREPIEGPAHCAIGEAMVETQLFLGLSKPSGGTVSAAQWESFLKQEIAPRFPEGFSVLDGSGFWRDGQTRRTIAEKSKVVVRLHPPGPAADTAIDEIAQAYKRQFAQESVLRVDRPVCAQF